MSIDRPMSCWSSKFGGFSDTYPHKTDLSNPPVSIFPRVIPQKQMSEYMSITRTHLRLYQVTPSPGMEDAELIIAPEIPRRHFSNSRVY